MSAVADLRERHPRFAEGSATTEWPPAPRRERLLDPVVVDELRDLDEEVGGNFLADLVAQFVRSTDPLFAELSEALRIGDAPAVGRIAHRIQGSSGDLGGVRLAASCGRLETKAVTGELAGGRRDMVTLQLDYDDLCRRWEQQLAA
jgi:HPt (histidine-containing phosphotransfer) domain-containing protein